MVHFSVIKPYVGGTFLLYQSQKVSISDFVGTIKGRTAIRIFNKFRHLKKKPYWGNHLWAKGYCVDTVGLDTEMIRKYVKHQEHQGKILEQ